MYVDDIRKYAPEAMTKAQREQFFEDGCLVLENAIDDAWLTRLRAAVDDRIDRSRTVIRNDGIFILEDGHSPEDPRLRRLTSPVSHHPVFWEFAKPGWLNITGRAILRIGWQKACGLPGRLDAYRSVV